MQHRDMQTIIDLTRYPLDRLDSEAGQSLVAQCREKLDERALCALPGAVKKQVSYNPKTGQFHGRGARLRRIEWLRRHERRGQRRIGV